MYLKSTFSKYRNKNVSLGLGAKATSVAQQLAEGFAVLLNISELNPWLRKISGITYRERSIRQWRTHVEESNMNTQEMVKKTEDCLQDMIESGLVVRVSWHALQVGTKEQHVAVVPWLSQNKPEAYKTMTEIQNRTKDFGFKVDPAIQQD